MGPVCREFWGFWVGVKKQGIGNREQGIERQGIATPATKTCRRGPRQGVGTEGLRD